MTIQEIIKKYRIEIVAEDGIDRLRLYTKKVTKEEEVFIKANRQQIIDEIKAAKAAEARERAEREAATIRFYSIGWESHEISIDTREDIEGQLRKWAEYYKNDCTFESLKKDYGDKIATDAKKAEQEKMADARIREIEATAINTGVKQIITRYAVDCNDPQEECSTDIVTIWAMPDGTRKTTREHTW